MIFSRPPPDVSLEESILAGLTRLELATFRVTGGRSNQLSYSPLRGTSRRKGKIALHCARKRQFCKNNLLFCLRHAILHWKGLGVMLSINATDGQRRQSCQCLFHL